MKITNIIYRRREAILNLTDKDNHYLGTLIIADKDLIKSMKQRVTTDTELVFKG